MMKMKMMMMMMLRTLLMIVMINLAVSSEDARHKGNTESEYKFVYINIFRYVA